MLEEDPKDLESEGLEKEASQKLATLRESLAAKKTAKGQGEPGAILASRAAAIAETTKKPKKNRDKAMELLKKALNDKKTQRHEAVKDEVDYDEDSSGSGEDSEDSGSDEALGEGLGKKSGAAVRQRKLRQYSEKKPGKLLSAGYQRMHEQIGTFFDGVTLDKKQSLTPVAVRYLLSFAMPQFSSGISADKYRELRTLASALDLIVVGKTGQGGDVLLQRFKSLLMALRDGTDAASRWIELLPGDELPTMASPGESYLAREMAVHEARSESLLRKASTI